MILAQARCFHAGLRFDPSGEHLLRMAFHLFRAAHAAGKMSLTSEWSTRSSDTLALGVYSAASAGRSPVADATVTRHPRVQGCGVPPSGRGIRSSSLT
jgi:hypothetical protein